MNPRDKLLELMFAQRLPAYTEKLKLTLTTLSRTPDSNRPTRRGFLKTGNKPYRGKSPGGIGPAVSYRAPQA